MSYHNAEDYARRIGRDIRNNGRSISSVSWYAPYYPRWLVVEDTLGKAAAVTAAQQGWMERDNELIQQTFN
jgi:superfamily II DNA/RNA helicase